MLRNVLLRHAFIAPRRALRVARFLSTAQFQAYQTALQPYVARLPRFDVHGADLSILQQPVELKEWLLERILQAKRNINLAALYIGKEETWLVDALLQALRNEPDLRVRLSVDILRTTRERDYSSANLLSALTREFPDRCHIALYHTPALTGFLKRYVPARYNEGWGLWHAKIYGIDDDVLISGANLSSDYFTNRQDRYIAIPNFPAFAKFCDELLETTSTFSYRLTSELFRAKSTTPFRIHWPATNPIGSPIDVGAETFSEAAREALGGLVRRWARQRPHTPAHTAPGELDTQLRPFFQMGQLGILDETHRVVPGIFQAIKALAAEGSTPVLDWTSGYFSLDPANIERILECDAFVRIICASPEANGFYRSKGVSGWIPPGYTLLERRFRDAVVARGKDRQISLREWSRSGWTYHSKGIWLSPDALDPPVLSVIGSSNYGVRSSQRDVEVNLLLTTTNPALRLALAEELRYLGRHARPVTEATFERPDRQITPQVRLATWLVRDML